MRKENVSCVVVSTARMQRGTVALCSLSPFNLQAANRRTGIFCWYRWHGELNGKTPAEIAEVKIEGQNKWITVIQNTAVLRGK